MTKFFLVAEVDDGLPPIKQEISAKHHAAYTGMENILSTVKLCECQGGPRLDADGMSKATSTYIHGRRLAEVVAAHLLPPAPLQMGLAREIMKADRNMLRELAKS